MDNTMKSLSPSEIALQYDNQRAEIVKDIIKAEITMDQRRLVIYTRRFLDAWPQGKLTKIEKAVKAVFEQKLKDAKSRLKGTCPVCGDHMSEQMCCDDLMRPYCPTCKRTYTPMGYDCQDDYALKWYAISWDMVETSEVIEVHA